MNNEDLDNFNTIYMSNIHQKNVFVYVGKS